MITWKDIDNLEVRRKAGETVFIHPSKYKDSGNYCVTATVLGRVSRFENTFIVYSYLYNNNEYTFAWETSFNEFHRGLHNIEGQWYDEVKSGDTFKVKIIKRDPGKHFIVNSPFDAMNVWVYWF